MVVTISLWFLKSGRKLSARRLDELTQQVCECSVPETAERLGCDPTDMSAAELRGYLRARAFECVNYHTHRVVAELGLGDESVEQLRSRALERTVQLMAKQFRVRPAACYVPLRLAG